MRSILITLLILGSVIETVIDLANHQRFAVVLITLVFVYIYRETLWRMRSTCREMRKTK